MIEVFPTLESPTNIILKAHSGKAGYDDTRSTVVVPVINIDFSLMVRSNKNGVCLHSYVLESK